MASVSTREITRAAGVNEVTIFRHFGDEATMADEDVRFFQPADQIDVYTPNIDTSISQGSLEGLAGYLGCRRPAATVAPRRADRLFLGAGACPEAIYFGVTLSSHARQSLQVEGTRTMNKKTALIASPAGLVRVLGGAGIAFAINKSGDDTLRSETRERAGTVALTEVGTGTTS